MENTYLQKVLRSLTKAEWRSFGDYLASPFFSKNKKFLQFYHLLDPYYPGFEIGADEKAALYLHSTGAKSYNDASYRNLCSDLLEYALNFLSLTYMMRESSAEKQFRTMALLSKNILPLAERTMEKTKVEIEKKPLEAIETLRTNIWLNDARIWLSIYSNRKKINASNIDMLEDKTYKVVTEYALVKAFISSINYLKACRNTGITYDETRVHTFLTLYEGLAPFSNPVTNVYYNIVHLIVSDDDRYYFRAKELFFDPTAHIPKINQENLLIGMIDYVISKVATDESWREELSFLYRKKLDDRMWNANKGLSYLSLFNAFLNELILGRLESAEHIFKTYYSDLHPDTGSSIVSLCEAWILYMRHDLDNAQAVLAKVETDNDFIKYSMRPLQCLIYYDKKEWDVLGSLLESFRHFIAYNKVNRYKDITLQYANFCKYLSAILRLGPNLNSREKEKLSAQIRAEAHVYLKKMLLEILR